MSDGLLLHAPVPRPYRRAPHPALPVDGAALLAAGDADADALADRLHDGALQSLVVARYAADLAVRGGDPALVRDAVQEALVALRREVWQLRPRPEDDLDQALRALSAQRVAAGGAPLDLGLDAALSAGGLAPAAVALAYRVVQSAALEPGPVRVGLTCSGGAAVLSVTGGPLDPAVWDARAHAVGGRFETVPAGRPPGRTARLLLPVSADPDPEGAR